MKRKIRSKMSSLFHLCERAKQVLKVQLAENNPKDRDRVKFFEMYFIKHTIIYLIKDGKMEVERPWRFLLSER